MTEFVRLAVLFVAAVNPAAAALAMAARSDAADARPRWQVAAVGMGVAVVCFVLATVFASRILDGLAIEPESFRIAAGGVMAMVGAQVIWRGIAAGAANIPARDGEGRWWEAAVFPLGIPILAGPAGIVAAMSISADHGVGKALGAVAIALAIAFVLLLSRPERARPALDGIARVTGALLVAFAVALVISGIKAV